MKKKNKIGFETIKFESEEEWLKAREGKITGSGLKDLVNVSGVTKEMVMTELDFLDIEYTKYQKKEELLLLLPTKSFAKLQAELPKKIAYYRLIAQKLARPSDGENPMNRGHRLEPEALLRFTKETGKEVDPSLIMWAREDNPNIAISPDGVVDVEEAVEVKCLESAKHIEAYLTQQIPDEYEFQRLQYFIVNDLLQTLHFVFYDPHMGFGKDFFTITFKREDLQEEIEKYLAFEKQTLAEVDEIVTQLTF